MHAAVVREFARPPRFEEFEAPRPNEHEVAVEVLAAGLHPRVRSSADGTHYTSSGALPFVPGIDGVGRTAEGRLLYFVLPDTPYGSMAEQTVVDRRRSVELPPGADAVTVAAAMNPAMSSWVALRRRVAFSGGEVAILGATGNAGRLAVQVARHLGATRVVAAGRNPARLATIDGADEVVTLDDLGAAADVDVVLDYLWGAPTEQAMPAIVRARTDRAKPLAWVQIGSVAGAEITLPSALLRAAALTVVGSGQGSVTTRGIVEELPGLAAFVQTLDVRARPLPLSSVEAAWAQEDDRRVVLTP